MAGKERDTARTRRAVLDAAAAAVVAHGAGVSLDAIARAADVSKGGLLHHFGSRDALLLEVAEDQAELFRDAVAAAVDPADHAKGRLVRAYVSVTFAALDDGPAAHDYVVLAAALSAVPGVVEVMRLDKQRWDEAFAADGLDPDRVLLVVRAADGAAVAGLYEGGYDVEQLRRTRELLLALTREDGPLVGS
ncbi:TetR/AcrR family transcriptional regulator [Motilibacter deserti]|uniref:TetR/AcrR family transcriptional regulator n=1 Tax=Motilibacter deserti TaxID=2714956 RepID=A0ABX0GPE3_9ACTN|nr:TetR/AcrR family transcriptional regulator [Motilibacter deserti]NHC12325.1 TetR/AcrR family transcriptional regulator [Motilibacter deserti]